MNINFNNHDLVVLNGHVYSVKFRSWSSDQNCYTLGLVGFDFNPPFVTWVRSDLVKNVS